LFLVGDKVQRSVAVRDESSSRSRCEDSFRARMKFEYELSILWKRTDVRSWPTEEFEILHHQGARFYAAEAFLSDYHKSSEKS
jgi:hypothetical protein